MSRWFSKTKDGGPESPVDAYFLFEVKWLCSVAVLKFNKGGREAYHTHAFSAWTWFLSGHLYEQSFDDTWHLYRPSILPKVTLKSKNHRVVALEDSWCLTLRGPWGKTWTEDEDGTHTVFTHGRIKIQEESK